MPSVRTIIPHKFFIFNHASLFSHCQIPVKQQLPVYYLEQIFILCAAYCAEPTVNLYMGLALSPVQNNGIN